MMLPKATEYLSIRTRTLLSMRKIQAAIGEYDEVLTLVKNGKLRWFVHVSRFSGLAKTILQSTVKGSRKRCRHNKTCHRDRIARLTAPCPSHKNFNVKTLTFC